jgi:hypothetical protein
MIEQFINDYGFRLWHGCNLDVLRYMEDNSVDSVVTDPPYGWKFMQARWDSDVPSIEQWKEVLRVLKPGGHILSFGGARTYHRLVVNLEDAGAEVREQLAWIHSQGFPKNLDISKAIDKAAGAEREVIGRHVQSVQTRKPGNSLEGSKDGSLAWQHDITAPSTEAAKQWQGWGSALKPALEPIVLARKPLIGTIAANVLAHGTGGLNIDGCRICDGSETGEDKPQYNANYGNAVFGKGMGGGAWANTTGRWPANLLHDGSDEVVALFPTAGGGFGKRGGQEGSTVGDFGMGATMETVGYGDSGSAARFFYCAKSSKAERNKGLSGDDTNRHATVKPLTLMRYLCRLITPPGGIVLDPWAGSGSTLIAAMEEGFQSIGIEKDQSSFETALARMLALSDER